MRKDTERRSREERAGRAARVLAGWTAAGFLAWSAGSYAMRQEDSSLRTLYLEQRRVVVTRLAQAGYGIDPAALGALDQMADAHRRLRSYSGRVVTSHREGGGEPSRVVETRSQVAFRRPGRAAVTTESVRADGGHLVRRALADGAGLTVFPDVEEEPGGAVGSAKPDAAGWERALIAASRASGGGDISSSVLRLLWGEVHPWKYSKDSLRSARFGKPVMRDGVPCVTVIAAHEYDGFTRTVFTYRFGLADGLLRERIVEVPKGLSRVVTSCDGVRANPNLVASVFAVPPCSRPYVPPKWGTPEAIRRAQHPAPWTPPGTGRRSKAERAAGVLAAALAGYLWDHDMTLPRGADWEKRLAPYAPAGRSWTLPRGTDGKPRRWVLNAAVAGRRVELPEGLRTIFGGPALSPRRANAASPLTLPSAIYQMPPAFFEAPRGTVVSAPAPAMPLRHGGPDCVTVTPSAQVYLREAPRDFPGGPPPGFEGGPPPGFEGPPPAHQEEEEQSGGWWPW